MYETALKILNKIEENGYKAYIVGGYPRDKYLNIDSTDIDICTNAHVSDLVNIFDNVDTKYKNYGNCNIYMNNYKFEVTTFRKEKYLKNRNDLDIEFIDSLEEDLKRRDFTINTLCIDKDGNYVDILNAIDDLDNKLIRLIGNNSRLKDDPLRILRAIRFSEKLNFKIDDKLLQGINKYGPLIKNISNNKLKEELNKINNINILKKYNLDNYIEKDIKIIYNEIGDVYDG